MAVLQTQDGLLRVVHDAFRRDADHLARAVETGAATDPVRRRAVLAGWDVFDRQLRDHHAGQDEHLWPALRGYLLARPEETALIDAMEDEHRRIEPLAAAVSSALHSGDLAWLTEAAGRFREELLGHLRHEEDVVVPLLAVVFSALDWRAYAAARRKSAGHKRVAEFLPYILDEAAPAAAAVVTEQLSATTRWSLRRRWQPRYAQTTRWDRAA